MFVLYLCTVQYFNLQLNFYISIGTHDEDLVYAEKILDDMLHKYPTGVYFLLFKGRLEEIKGNFDDVSSDSDISLELFLHILLQKNKQRALENGFI